MGGKKKHMETWGDLFLLTKTRLITAQFFFSSHTSQLLSTRTSKHTLISTNGFTAIAWTVCVSSFWSDTNHSKMNVRWLHSLLNVWRKKKCRNGVVKTKKKQKNITKLPELSEILQSVQTLWKMNQSETGQSKVALFFECSESWNNNWAFFFFSELWYFSFLQFFFPSVERLKTRLSPSV